MIDGFAFDAAPFDFFPADVTAYKPSPDLSGSVVLPGWEFSATITSPADDLAGSVITPGEYDFSHSEIAIN